jgi:hypothetical protein
VRRPWSVSSTAAHVPPAGTPTPVGRWASARRRAQRRAADGRTSTGDGQLLEQVAPAGFASRLSGDVLLPYSRPRCCRCPRSPGCWPGRCRRAPRPPRRRTDAFFWCWRHSWYISWRERSPQGLSRRSCLSSVAAFCACFHCRTLAAGVAVVVLGDEHAERSWSRSVIVAGKRWMAG